VKWRNLASNRNSGIFSCDIEQNECLTKMIPFSFRVSPEMNTELNYTLSTLELRSHEKEKVIGRLRNQLQTLKYQNEEFRCLLNEIESSDISLREGYKGNLTIEAHNCKVSFSLLSRSN
jgi:hypothetical protein